MSMSKMGLNPGQIVFAKFVRSKSHDGVSLQFDAPKGKEYCCIILSDVKVEERPSVTLIMKVMNAIGWYSGHQIKEALGLDAAKKMQDHLESMEKKKTRREKMI